MDRYLLPVVPMLALIAGAGWDHLRGRIAAGGRRPAPSALVPVAVAMAQVATLWPYLPDGITFYSPLLGGAAAAERRFVVGQGEGLERAAWYLNAEPGAATRTAAVPGFASAFAPYFRGRTIETSPASRDEWLAADRVVLYIHQMQSGWPDPALVGYLVSQQKPLYTVRMHGVDYAHVFMGPVSAPPELLEAGEHRLVP